MFAKCEHRKVSLISPNLLLQSKASGSLVKSHQRILAAIRLSRSDSSSFYYPDSAIYGFRAGRSINNRIGIAGGSGMFPQVDTSMPLAVSKRSIGISYRPTLFQ